ncbi:class I SAM-dependent DNA methyltransferase [Alkalibacterium sp. MB6]|uniref:class I SAM-dependent DNA methyltransferase n=1 Tax=Alkalibacterium sp. MB6 TaxID=2081965 RepID=UPI00137B4EBB|nr:class I SAM-dependent methyltransferase [Alkalibacterium sp. MB6]
MTYNWFAKVYDELMDDSLYDQWSEYTLSYVPKGASLLELGCGTGILGLKLKTSGYNVTGLDLSEDMLSIAYDRQMNQGSTFPLIHRDMRDLSDLPTYDSIVCYSDALCYMDNKTDLLAVFKEAYKHLNDIGLFLFDVHSVYQIKQYLATSFHAETSDIVFMWDSYEGEHDHSVEHDLTFFVENKDGLYERFEEVHKERTYPIEDYLELLNQSGFTDIEVTADFGQTVQSDSKRLFFACKK